MNKLLMAFLALLFVASTAAAQAPTVKVLIVGDSLTSPFNTIPTWATRWRDSRPDLTVDNRAFGGYTSVDAYKAVIDAWETNGPYDYVVVMVGINDPLVGVTTGARYQIAAAKYAKKHGATPILITAPGSSLRGKHFNAYISAQAKILRAWRRGKSTLDLRDLLSLHGFAQWTLDGTHPSDEGHEYLTLLLTPQLNARIGKRR